MREITRDNWFQSVRYNERRLCLMLACNVVGEREQLYGVIRELFPELAPRVGTHSSYYHELTTFNDHPKVTFDMIEKIMHEWKLRYC